MKITECDKPNTTVEIIQFKGVTFVLPTNIAHKCVRCGACCRSNNIPIYKSEIKRIKKLGYKESYFVVHDDTSTSLMGILYNKGTILKKVNGRCIFLKGKNFCTIYDYRPTMCKIYPYANLNYNPQHKRMEAGYVLQDMSDDNPICNGFFNGKPTRDQVRQAVKPIIDKGLYARRMMKIDSPTWDENDTELYEKVIEQRKKTLQPFDYN